MEASSWLLVGACTVVQIAIGSLWYGPINGKLFMSVAFRSDRPTYNPAVPMAVSMATALAVCATLHGIVLALGVHGLERGLQMAFVLWILGVLIQLPHPLFEDRPMILFVIHESYHLVSLITVCGILTVFG